ncbi:MAG: redoxin domain-containing protein [Luteolibacter sp.]
MKTIAMTLLAGACSLISAFAADVGQPAPAFSGKNLKGETVSLADLKGKVVVLEWVNFDCPFVKKHYSGGNLTKLQENAAGKDVVWVSINSSAAGKQGNYNAADMAARAEKDGNKASQFILDPEGTIGKAYGAKTTPHLFIINKEGVLVYNGAIDSKKSTDAADIPDSTPIFANALTAVLEGKAVENAKNEPYGCGVKY